MTAPLSAIATPGYPDTAPPKLVELNALPPVHVLGVSLRAMAAVEALGSRSALARHLGVSRTQPGRWISGAEQPSPVPARRIRDLDYLWGRLTSEMDDETARIWLGSPNSFLRGATPLNSLTSTGPGDVISALDALQAGSYA